MSTTLVLKAQSSHCTMVSHQYTMITDVLLNFSQQSARHGGGWVPQTSEDQGHVPNISQQYGRDEADYVPLPSAGPEDRNGNLTPPHRGYTQPPTPSPVGLDYYLQHVT
jgi:hypothetical protein